jgi:hypothetical protein
MECQKELGHPSFEPIIAEYIMLFQLGETPVPTKLILVG